VLPGVVLIVLIVSVNVLGDRMRDQLNPHLR
jgi:peptide/nickel transport system permease protein